jgi:cell division protein FtsB
LSSTQSKTSRWKVHIAAPDRLLWIVIGVIVAWGVWAFGSELLLNLRLDAQVQALQRENAQLTVANAQTRDQLQAAASPSSLEEVARQQGYARQNEQVYVIVTPTAPAPGASPAAAVPRPAATATKPASGTAMASAAARTVKGKPAVHSSPSQTGGIAGLWNAFLGWWKNLWQ